MVSGWLASPQSAARLCGYVCVCAHAWTLYTGPRPCTDTRTDAFQTLHQLQNWNFSINNNYHCQRADATSCSLPGPKWFSSVRLKCSIVKFNCKITFVFRQTRGPPSPRIVSSCVFYFLIITRHVVWNIFNLIISRSQLPPPLPLYINHVKDVLFQLFSLWISKVPTRHFTARNLMIYFLYRANKSTTRWGSRTVLRASESETLPKGLETSWNR